MRFTVGQQVNGYEIAEVLGTGGMSEVYHARDRASGAQVVLKIPHSYLIGDLSSFSRFQREVEIGKRLEHPNVQRLLATGQLDNGHTPYLVLEYVEGQSLRSYLDARKALPVDLAIALARQMADALSYCHAQGVVHRDLKPENVLITPDGRLKLMDFGIALLQGARRVTWGSLSSTVGTPDYMAPEQVRGDRGDERTDVYAVGVMLYEMLAGEVPFQGDSPLSVMSQRVEADPRPVSVARPDVPPGLAVVVDRALRRNPAERYPTMAAFAHDLAHLDAVDVAGYQWANRGTSGLPGRLITWLVVVGTLLALGLAGVAAELLHRAQVPH
jgi:eukaryotic-like serine/threonine-protein kinase